MSTRGPLRPLRNCSASSRFALSGDRMRQFADALSNALRAGQATPEAISAIPGLLTQPGARDLTVLIDELVVKEKDLRAQQQVYTDEFSKVKELQKSITELRTQKIPQAGRALLAQLQAREGQLNGQIAATSAEIQRIPMARTLPVMFFRKGAH